MAGDDVTVYWAGRYQSEGRSIWSGPSAKPFQVIFMVLAGRIALSIEGRTHRIGAGEALVFRSDLIGPLTADQPPTEYQWASFYSARPLKIPVRPAVADDRLAGHLFARLLAAFSRHGAHSDETRLWMQTLLQMLREDNLPAGASLSGQAEDVVRSAVQWIDAYPERCWSIGELAGKSGYSRTHFSRVFKQLTGRSPQQYHIDARMDRAQALLRETDLSITEISRRLGYRSVYHFSKQFRRQTGAPPSDVRTTPR
jgi:AraC-like DNA-binding protein